MDSSSIDNGKIKSPDALDKGPISNKVSLNKTESELTINDSELTNNDVVIVNKTSCIVNNIDDKIDNIVILEKERVLNTNIELKIKKKKKKRCSHSSCRKKLGIVDWACKCKLKFCSKHRFPTEHNCTFDWYTNERSILDKRLMSAKSDFKKVDIL